MEMFGSSYLDSSNGDNVTAAVIQNATCEGTLVTPLNLFEWFLIPAIVVTLCFCFMKKNRSEYGRVCKGFVGIVIPMDVLSGRRDQILYTACFGATLDAVLRLMDEEQVLPTAVSLKVVSVVFSVLMYAMVYYPLFAAVTTNSVTSYLIGSLYVWAYAVVWMCQYLPCDLKALTIEYFLLEFGVLQVPTAACLLIIVIMMPYRFVQLVREKETEKSWKKTYEVSHVTRLLKNESNPGKEFARSYSPRIVSSLMVGLMLVYAIGAAQVVLFIKLDVDLISRIDCNSTQIFETVLSSLCEKFVEHGQIFSVVGCVSTGLAACSSLYQAYTFLHNHRQHMLLAYKGQAPHLNLASDTLSMASSLNFGGYQMAYVAVGFGVQFLGILLILTLIIEGLILPFVWDYSDLWAEDLLYYGLLTISTAIVVYCIQLLLARYVFLQGPKVMALKNRNAYMILMYLMTFYNVLAGLVSSIRRVLMSIPLNIFYMSRLDVTSFPPHLMAWDQGFLAYMGFMKVESVHTNPTMLVFVHILRQLQVEREFMGDTDMIRSKTANFGEDSFETSAINTQRVPSYMTAEALAATSSIFWKARHARNRWRLAYTLIHNPSLKEHRKKQALTFDDSLHENKFVNDNDYSESANLLAI